MCTGIAKSGNNVMFPNLVHSRVARNDVCPRITKSGNNVLFPNLAHFGVSRNGPKVAM